MEMARLVHHPSSKARIICVLHAHMDESGVHPNSKVFVMAGYVATAKEWDAFYREWERALRGNARRPRVKAFKASACANLEGDFEGWSKDQTDELINDLITIITRRSVVGVAASVVKEGFYGILRGDLLKRMEDPYFLGFQSAVMLTEHIGMSEEKQIGFIFDEQDEFSPEALRLYGKIKTRHDFAKRYRLGAIAFESDENFLPIQAADMLAYEEYLFVLECLRNPDLAVERVRIRPYLSRLINEGNVYSRLFDERNFRELMEHQARRDTAASHN